MKVIIKPVQKEQPAVNFTRVTDSRKTDYGVQEQVVAEKELTRAPGTKQTICANPSRRLAGALNTGLTDMVVNIYKDLKNYATPDWEKMLKGKEEILLQTLLEYKHGKAINYYTNQPFRGTGDKSDVDKIPFFQTGEAQLSLNDGATILDTENPLDEIKYHICLANNIVANNYNEITGETQYVITSEEEEGKEKASKGKKIDKAISHIVDLEDKNDDTLIKFCKAIGDEVAKKGMTRPQAYNDLSAFVRSTSTRLAHFESIYKMYSETATRARFEALAFLRDLEDYGIVSNRGSKYVWYKPQEEDGKQPVPLTFDRKEEMLDFLTDPKFSIEYEEMKTQLKFKSRMS